MTRARPALLAAIPLALASVCLSPLAAQDAGAADLEAEAGAEGAQPSEGEARLAKLLEGRVAGEPVRCIRSLPSQRMQTIEGTAYVYGSGQTIFVQRTRDPENISTNDTLVINRFGASQLCRLDQITTVDRVVGFFTGVVFFEDFVPYTRVGAEAGSDG